MSDEKLGCCVVVWTPGGAWRGSSCARLAKVTVDGRGYCTQHDPANVQKATTYRRHLDDLAWKSRGLTRAMDKINVAILELVRNDLEKDCLAGDEHDAVDALLNLVFQWRKLGEERTSVDEQHAADKELGVKAWTEQQSAE